MVYPLSSSMSSRKVDALYIGRLGAAPMEAIGAATFALW
jgi:hypothetical protein